MTNQLADAKANYETLLAQTPDEQAAYAEIAAFRAELKAFLEEHRRREANFTEIQLTVKALKNAKAEVIRATRQLARAQITHAGDLRREEKLQAKAEEAQVQADKTAREELYERQYQRDLADARGQQAAERARGITDGSDAGNAAREAWLRAGSKL